MNQKKTIESTFVMKSEKLNGLKKEGFSITEAQILKEELAKIARKKSIFSGQRKSQ